MGQSSVASAEQSASRCENRTNPRYCARAGRLLECLLETLRAVSRTSDAGMAYAISRACARPAMAHGLLMVVAHERARVRGQHGETLSMNRLFASLSFATFAGIAISFSAGCIGTPIADDGHAAARQD